MNHKMLQYLLSLIMAAFFAADASGQVKGEPDRTVLPIAEPKRPTYKELDALKSGRNHHTANADHGDRAGFPRQHRADSERRSASRGNAAVEQLQQRRLRQVARNRRLGDQRVGAAIKGIES